MARFAVNRPAERSWTRTRTRAKHGCAIVDLTEQLGSEHSRAALALSAWRALALTRHRRQTDHDRQPALRPSEMAPTASRRDLLLRTDRLDRTVQLAIALTTFRVASQCDTPASAA
jgi:hypothetical protein